jgi:hypothetical protein
MLQIYSVVLAGWELEAVVVDSILRTKPGVRVAGWIRHS